ncbi:hypothetical protein L593_11955 [Salinarchaeum sp. Harcht-Bsk1]|nr:hypothetical protein L593_11955 [Salinarchaeum sp. Harcht-Bsk1]
MVVSFPGRVSPADAGVTMKSIELLYLAFSGTLAVAGLTMVGMAIRAYAETQRRHMVHLSIGFTLIVGAAVATTISAFINDFQNPQSLLTVNYFVTTLGFVFIVFSLVAE